MGGPFDRTVYHLCRAQFVHVLTDQKKLLHLVA